MTSSSSCTQSRPRSAHFAVGAAPDSGTAHRLLGEYRTEAFFDEMFDESGRPRSNYEALLDRIVDMPVEDLLRRQQAAERALLDLGITFNVYSAGEGQERTLPFDIVPRVVGAGEWDWIERGLKQRVYALNAFVGDVYGDQRILRDGVVPRELVRSCHTFRRQCMGLRPPRRIWCHITGTDLVRDERGRIFVLEDNVRCPSGVSYVLKNRQVMKATLPGVFESSIIRPVDEYCSRLLDMLECLVRHGTGDGKVAVLTPGPLNSAYFEHSFLAQQMGVDLVEGRDLVVTGEKVFMRTTRGFEAVDVLYRRIDDDYLDPTAFRDDSLLGVPGLMDVYRSGRLALANAPGTGIADDKVIYTLVPRMIEYYLGEEAIIPNVPTFLCSRDQELDHVLAHLGELVVKEADGSGGYGMLVGPQSTRQEREEFGRKIKAHPRNFIAQPVVNLSRVPVIAGDHLEGRHVDLRPFVLYGEDIYVLPGGLTRVALRPGSLVVNSSQGGGAKDTWVLSP